MNENNNNMTDINPSMNVTQAGDNQMSPMKPTPTPAKKNWSDREYFILIVETNETWKDSLQSEQECRDYIRVNGDYDIEYRVGYRVHAIKPITKRAKTVLN